MLLEILVDAYCYQKGSIIFFEPIKEKNSQNKYIFDFRKDFIRNLMVGNFNLYFIFKNKDNKLIHIKNNIDWISSPWKSQIKHSLRKI